MLCWQRGKTETRSRLWIRPWVMKMGGLERQRWRTHVCIDLRLKPEASSVCAALGSRPSCKTSGTATRGQTRGQEVVEMPSSLNSRSILSPIISHHTSLPRLPSFLFRPYQALGLDHRSLPIFSRLQKESIWSKTSIHSARLVRVTRSALCCR